MAQAMIKITQVLSKPTLGGKDENFYRDVNFYFELHFAAAEDTHETAVELIETGTNVNVMDGNSNISLHIAALKDTHKVASVLLTHDADVNAKNADGAAREPKRGSYLVMSRPGPAATTLDTPKRYDALSTPLHIAALKNAHETAVELLKHGADIEARSNDGKRPRDIKEDWGPIKPSEHVSEGSRNPKEVKDFSHSSSRMSINKETHVFTRHTQAVNSLAFSPDGNTRASDGMDAMVVLWELNPPFIAL